MFVIGNFKRVNAKQGLLVLRAFTESASIVSRSLSNRDFRGNGGECRFGRFVGTEGRIRWSSMVAAIISRSRAIHVASGCHANPCSKLYTSSDLIEAPAAQIEWVVLPVASMGSARESNCLV